MSSAGISIRTIVKFASILIVLVLPSQTAGKAGEGVEGMWEGTIDVEGVELRLVLTFSRDQDGKLGGMLESPDQGVSGIPIDDVSFEENQLKCEVRMIQFQYEGDIDAAGKEIRGSMTQHGISRTLNLKRVMKKRRPEQLGKIKIEPSLMERISGYWMGTPEFAGLQMRIGFRLNPEPDSTLTATMDSPDQGVTGIQVDVAFFENDHLRLEIQSAMAVYEGDLSDDGFLIQGELRQHGMSVPLTLERHDAMPEPNRPQEPKPPYPYDEEDVFYRNEIDGVTLAGTLTHPGSGGPFPAVLLITGSGPQDRNEAILGHKPFLVLADYLTRRGFAVLRVDDRGMGGSSMGPVDATSEDFARDVLAGVKFLKTRPEIDSARIGLLGHSEGGMIAPVVATRSSDVSFIVMVAGPGVIGEKVLYEQAALMFSAEGISDDIILKHRSLQERMFEVLKEEEDNSVARERLRAIMSEIVEAMAPEELQAIGLSEDVFDAKISQVMSPWFRYFLTYDPRLALMEVRCPVLAINGEKDLQVPAKENLRAIEEALKAGGNEDYTIKELPGLNHLLQTAETGSVSEYAKIEETISPSALELIGDWIEEHAK